MKSESPLLKALQNQVSPWIKRHGINNLVVAYPTLQETNRQELPGGVTLSPKPFISQPITVKGKKMYQGDAAEVDIHWPGDNMFARRVPALSIVSHGHAALPYGDYYLHCQSGHFIVIPPGTQHSDGSYLGLDENFRHSGNRQSINFMVRGNGVECWLKKVENYQHVPTDRGEQYYLSSSLTRQYLETLSEEMTGGKPYSHDLATCMLQALIVSMSRGILCGRALHSEPPQAPLSNHIDDESQLIARAEEYLRNHLHEELTIDKTAKAMHVSRSYFTRAFRAHTGKTFIGYVTQCRLNEAKVLLQDTEWPITKIGESIGLKPSRLREIFQQQEGLSPIEYRENILRK